MPEAEEDRKRRTVASSWVRQRVEEWATVDGLPAFEIYSRLELLKKDGVIKTALPTQRTIERMVRAIKSGDKSPPWSLAEADPADAGLVLGVLAAIIIETEGRRRHVSKDLAAWIVKIRCIAPDLEAFEVFRIAMEYQRRVQRDESTDHLDAYMAFAPWRGEKALELYLQVLEEDWIKPPWHTFDRAASEPDWDKADVMESPTTLAYIRSLWSDGMASDPHDERNLKVGLQTAYKLAERKGKRLAEERRQQ
ncbi:MAG: hypothetical protein HYX89_08855 [Chloroflexi bacterium]|nr:hypothetical protein [Chloroflexota bacterium]